MNTEKCKVEAEELDKLRRQLIRTTINFTQGPIEGLYWEITELLSEYGEAYMHHHAIDRDEIPPADLDALSTTVEAGIILPDNVIPFRR